VAMLQASKCAASKRIVFLSLSPGCTTLPWRFLSSIVSIFAWETATLYRCKEAGQVIRGIYDGMHDVALKISESDVSTETILREISILKNCRHSNIVQVQPLHKQSHCLLQSSSISKGALASPGCWYICWECPLREP
jgi:hypothetical protein